MKVKVGYAKNLRVSSGWVGYRLVFGQSIREVLNQVYRWHKVPSIVKARAVLLYFKGIKTSHTKAIK